MSDPSDPLLYVTTLEEVFWGGRLVVITMALHGLGMLAVLRVNQSVKHWLGNRTSFMAGMLPEYRPNKGPALAR